MAIKIPNTAKEIEQRMKTDVQRQVAASNPFLKNSWLGAIITSIANRLYDYYLQLIEATSQFLPDTATGDILERWSAIFGIIRNPATRSVGKISATGTASSVIPLGTLYNDSNGNEYETTLSATITAQVFTVASITRSGSEATVTLNDDHGFGSNVTPSISGAVESEYNLSSIEIQVTGPKTFTYQVTGSPSTPATGTILCSATFASVSVQSTDYGSDQDQSLDVELTLQSPISGVDDAANVDYDELTSGTDQEIDDDLRLRLLDRIQNPVALFNSAAIIAKGKEVSGVTRVFVQEVTPSVGQVTVYIMRDNDVDPIASSAEVTETKNKILEIKPANMSDDDLIVAAPSVTIVNFDFSAITPNTTTMQNAIKNNLQLFFNESVSVGKNIDEDLYRSAIISTVDDETGDKVEDFILTIPSGDIAISPGFIGILGNVTFP